MKNILALIISSITLFAISAPVQQTGRMKLGKVNINNPIVLGVEAGEGVTVTDGYKVDNTYTGYTPVEYTISTVKTYDSFVKLEQNGSGSSIQKVLVITGRPRHSYKLVINTDIDILSFNMPNSSGFNDWMVYMDYNGTKKFNVAYNTDNVTAYSWQKDNDLRNSGTNNEYVVVFSEITKSIFNVISVQIGLEPTP